MATGHLVGKNTARFDTLSAENPHLDIKGL
jgi:hypothetical protein